MQLNRRKFFLGSLSAVFLYAFAQFPLIFSCRRKEKKMKYTFSHEDEKLWLALASTFCPSAPEQPGQINTGFLHHIFFTLNDSRYNAQKRNFIREGFILFKKRMAKQPVRFYLLPYTNREENLRALIEETYWGEEWLSLVMNLMMESCFLDPHYHVNLSEVGWKWIGHHPGRPRPDKTADYFSLLKKRKKTEIITAPV
jgi:hypothetical protein